MASRSNILPALGLAAAGGLLTSLPGAFLTPSLRGSSNAGPLATTSVTTEAALSAAPSPATSQPALLAGAALLAVGSAVAVKKRGADSAANTVAVKALPKQLEFTGGPFPGNTFDPLNLMKGKSEEQILHWRAVEVKHARVAMLAVLGWFHNAGGWHFIGDAAVGFRMSDDPLVSVTQLPMGAAWQVIFTILCFEWLTTYICKPPKDAPWDVFGLRPIIVDNRNLRVEQLKELNNGRLAMIAFIGLVMQDVASGGTEYGQWIQNLYPTTSPDNGGLPIHPNPIMFPNIFYFLDGNQPLEEQELIRQSMDYYKQQAAASGAPADPFEGTPYW